MINFLLKIEKWLEEKIERFGGEETFLSFNRYAFRRIYHSFKKYAKYSAENGLRLPEAYKNDPAAWLVVIQKIEFAFDKTWDIYFKDVDINEGKSEKEAAVLKEKINEGFVLFGQHFNDLWEYNNK